MACDLEQKLKEGLSPEAAEIVLSAFNAGRADIDALKKKSINNVSKSGGASILSMMADLASENLSIGAMDKVKGDMAPERAQPIAVASGGTSFSEVDESITSSGMEDYPNSIVDIDSAGNWKKVNKTTGQVDWVHNSGSKISFYKNGDVVMHVAANFKQVIENDYIVEVGRNFEVTSGKETHITSKESMYVTSESNLFETTAIAKVQTVPAKVQLSAMTAIVSPVWNLLGSETIMGSVSISNNISSSSGFIGMFSASRAGIGSLCAGSC